MAHAATLLVHTSATVHRPRLERNVNWRKRHVTVDHAAVLTSVPCLNGHPKDFSVLAKSLKLS